MGWFSGNEDKKQVSCDHIRIALIKCIRASKCYTELKETPRECLNKYKNTEYLPDKCSQLNYRLFECKRSLIDMRQRFRGRKGQLLEGDIPAYEEEDE